MASPMGLYVCERKARWYATIGVIPCQNNLQQLSPACRRGAAAAAAAADDQSTTHTPAHTQAGSRKHDELHSTKCLSDDGVLACSLLTV
jgi:hypothetical protein